MKKWSSLCLCLVALLFTMLPQINLSAYAAETDSASSEQVTMSTQDDVSTQEESDQPVWVMAWVVDPKFDAANEKTTRTPDADGYYSVELSVDGVTKTYKTNATGLFVNGQAGIDYVDLSGSKGRAVAICLTEEGSLEFTEAQGATNHTGATGAKVTTVTAVDGNVITGTGVDYTGKVAANGKIFDVSPNATVEGEVTELKVGDYCRFYTDDNGVVLYGYVYTRAGTVDSGSKPEPEVPTAPEYDNSDLVFEENTIRAYCTYCCNVKEWTVLNEYVAANDNTIREAGHYFLTDDIAIERQINFYADACVHLNGHNISSTQRAIYVDATQTTLVTLNIMGCGVVSGAGLDHATVPRGTVDVAGTLNICGGVFEATGNNPAITARGFIGRSIVNIYEEAELLGVTTNMFVSSQTVNVYGGKFIGGATEFGTYSNEMNIYGGEFTGNSQIILFSGAKTALNISGTPVISKLVVGENQKITVGTLTAGANVAVEANGVFTNEFANAQAYLDAGYFVSSVDDIEIKVEGNALAIVSTATPEKPNPEVGTVTQPKDAEVVTGALVQFSVKAGGEVRSYEWQYKRSDRWHTSNLDGWNTNTLSFYAFGNRDGYRYRCVVTFADGTSVVSEEATLRVKTEIIILDQPTDCSAVPGGKVLFTVKAYGEGLKCQWQHCPSGGQWTDLSGKTKQSLSVKDVVDNRNGQYRCRLTDTTGLVAYTDAVTFRVQYIVKQPDSVTATVNTKATFQIEAGLPEGFTYQWQYSRFGILWFNTTSDGYNTDTLTVSATMSRDGYYYRCVIKDARGGKLVSQEVRLHVDGAARITEQPKACETLAETAEFSVKADNVRSYQWQWALPGGEKWFNTDMDGAKTDTLQVKVSPRRNGYRYRCVLTGYDGEKVYTEEAELTFGS